MGDEATTTQQIAGPETDPAVAAPQHGIYTVEGKTLTLAKATPGRMARFYGLMQITDLHKLKDPETQSNIIARYQEINMSGELTKALLDVCTNEDLTEINGDNIDLEILDKAYNDFFKQRLPK